MKDTEREEIRLLENLFEYIIPKYREAHDILVSMLDFPIAQEARFADLGCGFGELSKHILYVFSSARIYGIDSNPDILQRCSERLKEFDNRFIPLEKDLSQPDWSEGIEALDGIVSSFTLDYLSFDRHKSLIGESYNLLKPQGRWVSCEFFQTVDPRVHRVFHDLEIQFIQNALKEERISKKQVDLLAKSRILRKTHHVCTVDTKVEWLRAAGFDKVDVPWRFLSFAVISAVK
jgi:tRNA (cmo5U34)-methyltransferase